jgi:hypothetical protein
MKMEDLIADGEIGLVPDPVSETAESALNFDSLDGTKKKPRKTKGKTAKAATTAEESPLPKKVRTRRRSSRRSTPKAKAKATPKPTVEGKPGLLRRGMNLLFGAGGTAAAGAGAEAAAGGGFLRSMAGNIPLALAFTLIPMAIDRLTRGSEEDQMRSSMEIQRKLQAEAEGGGGQMGGDMSGMSGLMEDEPRMGDLLAEQGEVNSARNLGYAGNNLSEKMYRGSNFGNSSQLAGLIGGDTARLAQLQSERTLSPAEIMSIINSDRG